MSRVFIVSSAQNNTKIHKRLWNNLNAYASFRDAEILISRFAYRHTPSAVSRAKSGTPQNEDWWDQRIGPYVLDERKKLASGLDYCGELQISPTAVRPFSGLNSYTGRASSIIPHVKFSVITVPTHKTSDPKFMYTTGTVTERNYIQAKAGQKASFHHGLGALVVEVDDSGIWWVRQLAADYNGDFYDLNWKIANNKVTDNHRPEALVWGDIHVHWVEPWMKEVCWGSGGILETLKPKIQVYHDLLDFRSQNHHDRGKPWVEFKKMISGSVDVDSEINQARDFLNDTNRRFTKTLVIASNHDEALNRWLQEVDWRQDVLNSEIHLKLNRMALSAARESKYFNPTSEAIGKVRGVEFLKRDESYVICKRHDGGIELAMHGDLGVNGGRGTPMAFSAMGRRVIVGHHHSASWVDGCITVGVTGNLDMGYNRGLSGWSHTNALVYPNGKKSYVYGL